MKKQILSEELKRMYKLAGLINESEIGEGRYGRGSYDPWADIETGGEYSKSKERVSASYERQKEEDSLGSTSYQSFTNKIKRLGPLMTDDEAVEMMDDMKRMLSQDEIMDVYNFVDRNNISSPIYTYLDQYKGETRSYGNYGLEESDTKKVIDLSKYDSHILDQLRQKFARTYGDMPSDEELKNIISAMPELNKEGALEESELLKEETIEDFFEFLGKNPGKSSMATVMYTNPVKVNKFIIDDLGNKVPNPMFDKLFKNTRFMFRWQDTYNRAVERNNPEHEFGKRSGTFEKVEGVDVLERGKSGLYLPIIPTGSESAYSVYENGKFSPISKEEARKYMPEYKEREGGSGVDFRPLIVDRISKINAGGNNWINPNFQYEYLGPERMAEDVMIKEGQLGRAITKMLIEEMLKENEEEVAKRVQELLNPHDYITLKAGTLLTINRPPGFIQIPKETEAVYFGVNKFNQVEVAVRKDLGWNTGTVEFGDIRDLFDESGSYGLEDVPPYEGPEDPMDHQVAEVMIKEGQLGKAITKMLIEEMLKEEEVDDKTLLDNIDDLRDYDIHPITSILPSQYSDGQNIL